MITAVMPSLLAASASEPLPVQLPAAVAVAVLWTEGGPPPPVVRPHTASLTRKILSLSVGDDAVTIAIESGGGGSSSDP